VSNSINSIVDENKNLIGFSIISRDITSRKRAENALRESESELKLRNNLSKIFLTTPDDKMYADVLDVVRETLNS
jgi:hypothetical protein